MHPKPAHSLWAGYVLIDYLPTGTRSPHERFPSAMFNYLSFRKKRLSSNITSSGIGTIVRPSPGIRESTINVCRSWAEMLVLVMWVSLYGRVA